MKLTRINQADFLNLRLDKDSISWLYRKLIFKNTDEYCYASSLKLITNGFHHLTLARIREYWLISLVQAENQIKWHNWMYLGCLIFSFRKISKLDEINITLNDRHLGLQKFKNFQDKPTLTFKEIKNLLNEPILLCNNQVHIINGFHRTLCILSNYQKLVPLINVTLESNSCGKCS